MARGSDELRRFIGIESTAAAYLQHLLTGSQVERFEDRVAPDDRVVRLRISALYPPHLIIEHDVRHGFLLSLALPLRPGLVRRSHWSRLKLRDRTLNSAPNNLSVEVASFQKFIGSVRC